MKKTIYAITCVLLLVISLYHFAPLSYADNIAVDENVPVVDQDDSLVSLFPVVTQNLFYSSYSANNVYCNSYRVMDDPITQGYYNDYYDDGLQLRANCYGYAFRFFYRAETIPNEQMVDYNDSYKQHPGEFASKSGGFNVYYRNGSLCRSIPNYLELDLLYSGVIRNSAFSNDEKIYILEQLLEADAETLGYTITSCAAASVPNSTTYNNKRLIAVVVGGNDFHFYMQHSNGTWSHKPGNNPTSNCCLCSQSVVLTNNNIEDHAAEGLFAGGVVKFYYITKNTVIDFGHANGKYAECTQTSLYTSDAAGNEPETAKGLGTISQISQFGFVDYVGDQDYYYFVPNTTKSYIFSSSTSSSLPIKVLLYDQYGELLTSHTSNSGAVYIIYTLNDNFKYFICIQTYNQEEHEYMRTYTVTVQ